MLISLLIPRSPWPEHRGIGQGRLRHRAGPMQIELERPPRRVPGCSKAGVGADVGLASAPSDVVTWTSALPEGVGDHGTVQWTEHERPIDRFEDFRRRQAPGRPLHLERVGVVCRRLLWTTTTAQRAQSRSPGMRFSSQWQASCKTATRPVAIGVRSRLRPCLAAGSGQRSRVETSPLVIPRWTARILPFAHAVECTRNHRARRMRAR